MIEKTITLGDGRTVKLHSALSAQVAIVSRFTAALNAIQFGMTDEQQADLFEGVAELSDLKGEEVGKLELPLLWEVCDAIADVQKESSAPLRKRKRSPSSASKPATK